MTGGMVALLTLWACVLITDTDELDRLDPDRDGVLWPHDCDDNDPEVGSSVWYRDNDRDDWGDEGHPLESCEDPGDQYAAVSGDCDDDNGEISPDSPEVCDPADQDEDCNGVADNDDDKASGMSEYLQDNDGDGYGTDAVIVYACEPEEGMAEQGGDCDDDDHEINPGARDYANGLDDNCDGTWDEGAVYFVSDDGGAFEIWRSDPDFKEPARITSFSASYGDPGPPRVSPDGRLLSWVTDFDTIVTYNVAGQGVEESRAVDAVDEVSLTWLHKPSAKYGWMLLYTKKEDPVIYGIDFDDSEGAEQVVEMPVNTQIFNIDVDALSEELIALHQTSESCEDASLTRVLFDGSGPVSFGENLTCSAGATRWSPDGKWLSQVRTAPGGDPTVAQVDATTGIATPIVNLASGGLEPTRYGSPYLDTDDPQFVITVSNNGSRELWIIHVEDETYSIVLPDTTGAHEAFGAEVVRGQ